MSRLSAAGRWALLTVLGLTLIGLALRIARYQQSLFGDEMSTLYVVDGRSLSDVFSLISSDAEISPPLYFVLAWLTTKLGSAPELIRLPSLIAGTASIPLVYWVGLRAVGRTAGLMAAAVMTLSPFMIFYSADGRGYARGDRVPALLDAGHARGNAGRTDPVVGALRAVLGAGDVHALHGRLRLDRPARWVLWARPEVAAHRRSSSTSAAAVRYLPWVPSLLDDFASPTIDVLYLLQGTGFAVKRAAIEVWAVGYPFRDPSELPGAVAGVLGLAGFAIAVTAGLVRHFGKRAEERQSGGAARPLISRGMALTFALAFSAMLIELLMLVLGNDLLGARNLAVSSAGLALFLGAVMVSAGRRWGTVAAVAVLACFVIGATRTLDTSNELVDLKAAAAYIDAKAGPEDVVVDMLSPRVTPVPLTELDAYLPQTRPEYRTLLPEGEPPFLPLTPVRRPGASSCAGRRGGRGADGMFVRRLRRRASSATATR